MAISKENTLTALRTFKDLQDAANEGKFVAKEQGKMLTSNDFTDALKNKLEGLNNYLLPTASTSMKGGVKIGDGLKMTGDTLSVTLDSGEKYSEFTGATATTAGTSGLVTKPNAGDADKFLRGDGTWAEVNNTTVINMAGSATIIDTKVPTIQGALWQDVIGGAPCLKLRYDDYEYNFYYDTITQVGTVTPVLDTTQGMIYTLGTVPATVDGGLWYKVESDKPVLKMHDGNYDYGYLYDTITYKGGNTDLTSYIPFNSSADDALSILPWTTSGTPTVVVNPILNDPSAFGGRAFLGNSGTIQYRLPVNDKTLFDIPFTIDFWFSADYTIAPSQNADILTFHQITNNNATKSITLDAKLQANATGFAIGVSSKDTMPITDYVRQNQRNHFALTVDQYILNYFINGQCVRSFYSQTYNNSGYAFTGSLQIGTASTGTLTLGYTGNAFAVYVDHFRIHRKILWDNDFTPPVPSDYL